MGSIELEYASTTSSLHKCRTLTTLPKRALASRACLEHRRLWSCHEHRRLWCSGQASDERLHTLFEVRVVERAAHACGATPFSFRCCRRSSALVASPNFALRPSFLGHRETEVDLNIIMLVSFLSRSVDGLRRCGKCKLCEYNSLQLSQSDRAEGV